MNRRSLQASQPRLISKVFGRKHDHNRLMQKYFETQELNEKNNDLSGVNKSMILPNQNSRTAHASYSKFRKIEMKH